MTATSAAPPQAATTVTKSDRWFPARRFASLVIALARKNFAVRYRRTALGLAWAVLQPVVQTAVVSLVFQRLFRGMAIPHYWLFVLAGILPWSFATRSLTSATSSVVDNASLVRKVAVSRLIYPLAALGSSLAVFAVSLVVLIAAAAFAGTLSVAVLLLPLAIALQILVITGPALWAAAYFVTYRDVRFAIESGLLVAFYATPVIYPASRLGELGASLLRANPMTGVLSLYRVAVHGSPVDLAAVAVSVVFGVVALASGLLVFHRKAADFADVA